jgi:hypothetical protein
MNDHKWQELCQAIMAESDPHKLLKLVTELNRVLDEREQELRRSTPQHDLGL